MVVNFITLINFAIVFLLKCMLYQTVHRDHDY